jgi:hypothetical protein
MTKLLATVVTLKGILIAASIAVARGDAVPVVLISALFSLVQLDGKPVRQVVPQETTVVSSSHDRDGQTIL